jgi:hypothetical protein
VTTARFDQSREPLPAHKPATTSPGPTHVSGLDHRATTGTQRAPGSTGNEAPRTTHAPGSPQQIRSDTRPSQAKRQPLATSDTPSS